ncbi:MAG: divalent-cation tolerance protein CutA [Proteobacteria bacterium]|nr:divalent-cation tolerance protein CutA [Pseudomonadota bacterium]
MTSQLSLLYTTFATEEEAISISKELLQRHMIGCVNILGKVRSLYFWDQELQDKQEISVLFKTTSEKMSELIEALNDLHPYEVPMILEIPITRANSNFVAWVQEAVI